MIVAEISASTPNSRQTNRKMSVRLSRKSDLEEKWKQTHRALRYSSQQLGNCHLCERHCGVDRWAGERGFCGIGAQSRYYSALLNYGEEPFLSPSYCIYFTGCEMRCVFCSAYEWVVRPETGEPLNLESLVAGLSPEARTVSFIGGNPSVNMRDILRFIDLARPAIPLCWNSNFYETPGTLENLFGIIDVFQADYKFGNPDCAERLAKTPRYQQIVESNLRLVRGQALLVIRHLLMPGHVDCCFVPVCRWVRDNCPDSIFFLMTGYIPWGPAGRMNASAGMRRQPDGGEIIRAQEICDGYGLRWIQSG